MLNVSVLCSDPKHPVNPVLSAWARAQRCDVKVNIKRCSSELEGGDFLFLVSCHEIVGKAVRDIFRHTLVLHASALPRGRGMSPHIWQIIEGAEEIVVTLLNAEDKLDSGDIWHQVRLRFDGTELYDEINRRLFDAELELMNWALCNCNHAKPRPQQGEASYYRMRVPADSEIDPELPLAESFNLLRASDPERYPAFVVIRGQKYRVRIDKA